MQGPIRHASQAGRFYTADPASLRQEVERYIENAKVEPLGASRPIGFVAPHAGYEFSGRTAGHAYRALRELSPKRIFILSPSHHAFFPMASLWEGGGYETPLGLCEIDIEAADALRETLPDLRCERHAEQVEHAIEVHIPFIQVACPEARIVPLLLGSQDEDIASTIAETIVSVCESLGVQDTVFIASTDAYHGYSLDECLASDAQFAKDLSAMNIDELFTHIASRESMACGYGPVAAVMQAARHFGATKGKVLHQSTSADIVPHDAGSYVVGYVSCVFL
jgi:AmmeMemoRadiSam system protein B